MSTPESRRAERAYFLTQNEGLPADEAWDRAGREQAEADDRFARNLLALIVFTSPEATLEQRRKAGDHLGALAEVVEQKAGALTWTHTGFAGPDKDLDVWAYGMAEATYFATERASGGFDVEREVGRDGSVPLAIAADLEEASALVLSDQRRAKRRAQAAARKARTGKR